VKKGNFLIFHASTAMEIILVANVTLFSPSNFVITIPISGSASFVLPKDLVDHIPHSMSTYPVCMHLYTTHFVPEVGCNTLL
jgi:hypothetical protein